MANNGQMIFVQPGQRDAGNTPTAEQGAGPYHAEWEAGLAAKAHASQTLALEIGFALLVLLAILSAYLWRRRSKIGAKLGDGTISALAVGVRAKRDLQRRADAVRRQVLERAQEKDHQ